MFKPTTIRGALATLIQTLFMSASQAASTSDFEQGLEAYIASDYETAIAKWRPLAEQGDAYAQHNFGGLYEKGLGVPQDTVLADMWYNLAAAHGEALSSGFTDG